MIIINCGDGKGKTTAAIGQAIRAIGQGLNVKFIQFIKDGSSGEIEILRRLNIIVEQYGLGFTNQGDRSNHKLAAERGLEAINESIEKNFDMIICDEINYAISGNLIDEEKILNLIFKARKKNIHLVLTGRNPTEKMIQSADIVTNMIKVKHAFDNGVTAQRGIEY